MGSHSKIEWTDHTFNPWEGCQKVGPGCDNCYAEARNSRFAGGQAINWGPGAPRRRTSKSNWHKPLAWNRKHSEFFAEHGRRQRVFCASLADVFDNEVPPAWRADLFKLIVDTPHLDWLLLTKRIGNVMAMLPFGWQDFGMPANIWLGATVVNQEEADRDIPKLLATSARVRFLSMEPLLGPVDIEDFLHPEHPHCTGYVPSTRYEPGYCDRCAGHESDPIHTSPRGKVDWVIVGGESGPNARPMHSDWAQSLRDQCAAAGVPFLFKQWGEFAPGDACEATTGDAMYDLIDAGRYCVVGQQGDTNPRDAMQVSQPSEPVYRAGKKATGRTLDNRTWDQFPTYERVRRAGLE